MNLRSKFVAVISTLYCAIAISAAGLMYSNSLTAWQLARSAEMVSEARALALIADHPDSATTPNLPDVAATLAVYRAALANHEPAGPAHAALMRLVDRRQRAGYLAMDEMAAKLQDARTLVFRLTLLLLVVSVIGAMAAFSVLRSICGLLDTMIRGLRSQAETVRDIVHALPHSPGLKMEAEEAMFASQALALNAAICRGMISGRDCERAKNRD